MLDNDYARWISATKEENHLMHKNGVWSLVDMLKLDKQIKCKWVFTRKKCKRKCGNI